MKKPFLIGIAIVALFVSAIVLADVADKKNTPEMKKNSLTTGELENILTKKGDELIYFYKDGCKYCAKAEPIFIPIIEELNISMKAIDMSKEMKAGELHNIQGTPTIIHFKDGKAIDVLDGLRTENEYQEWFENNKQ